MWRIWFPALRDSQKQGKLGLDVGAPREALDLTPCERGKPADGPRSPPHFANLIRTLSGKKHTWEERPASDGLRTRTALVPYLPETAIKNKKISAKIFLATDEH